MAEIHRFRRARLRAIGILSILGALGVASGAPDWRREPQE
jgi:hypothetical protein